MLLNAVNCVVRNMANLPGDPKRSTLLLAGAGRLQPTPPVNLAELPATMQPYFDEWVKLPPVYLHKLRRMAVSWHMVVFRRLRIFLPAVAHPREEGHYNDAYLFQEWTGRKVAMPRDGRPLALVHNQWTGANYYHWLVDSLPRLLLLQANFPASRLVMPSPVAGFVRDSAALLGFTEVLSLQEGQTLVNADLLVPDHVTAPGYQHPALLQQVRAQLLAGLYGGTPLPTPHRRVYVSRRSQPARRVSNEDAIAGLLKQYDYETVEFEQLSFEAQIRLMAETKRFISIHGAGMTNMLFLPPTACVVELLNTDKLVVRQNQDFENLIYFRMASALQLPYYCLPCIPTGDEPLTNVADLQVDVRAFEQMLLALNE